MFRRAMKRAMQNAMRLGAQGIRSCPGPSERCRNRSRRVVSRRSCRCTPCAPTSTTALPKPLTTYGIIGVKVGLQGRQPGRADAPSLDSTPRPDDERRPRGPRRDARGDRPGRGGPRRGGSNAAPADGSDKPQA